jgi:hypoxanthine phosphoribosyltransferase
MKLISNGRKAATSRKIIRIPSTSENPAVPKYWRPELDRVLISERALQKRVTELGADIERYYRNKDLVLVALLNGTVVFLADLIRQLELPLHLDFIGVSSYGANTRPGELHFTKELRLDVRGRDVLVVDDILDTGRTLAKVLQKLRRLRPRSIRICVLLNKQSRRQEKIEPDHVGFDIPDEFVVGYGLDYAEQYRNLPFVAVLKRSVYAGE